MFNGLLLSPGMDAAFDAGLVTVGYDGEIVVADALDGAARATLRLDGPVKVPGLTEGHRRYLGWHRGRVFLERS